jgi:hypothetical protein
MVARAVARVHFCEDESSKPGGADGAWTGLSGRATIRDALLEGGCGCFGPRMASQADDAGSQAIARNLALAMLAAAATA